MRIAARTLLWIKALRAPFFTASGMSAVVGSAAAWSDGSPRDYTAFAFTVTGVVALHAGANLANDYYDHLSGNDAANKYFNPFSGGSRLIQNRLMPPRHILAGSAVSFAVAALCAAYLLLTRWGWEIPLLGCLGLLLGFLYTAAPVKLSYRGLGEAAIFAAFGPLATAGSYFVQAGHITATAVGCGVPVGILVALILLVNEFPDREADGAAGKRTLIVRLGLDRGLLLCAVLYALAFAAAVALVWAGLAPRWTYIVLAALPLPAFALLHLSRHSSSPGRLVPSSAAGVLTHLAFSALMALSYLI